MRFNNEDYLKAFPREGRDSATPPKQTIKEQQAGDVFDQDKEEPEIKKQVPEDSEPEDQGGAENGDE